MKKGTIVKGIINYIFAMIFAIIFGLFLDANVGWFILFTLILAPFLSVFLAWLAAHMITVSGKMSDALLSKGDSCTMEVQIVNNSIFPTPPLEVFLTNEPGVRGERRSLLVSLLPRGSKSFEVAFRAKISGKSLAGVEKVKVTDYLGLFSFEVKKQDYGSMQSFVAVIPDIAELSARDDNLMKAMQASLHMDDGEETVESSSFCFGGFPGYDNREYVPGDPLKRVNWKLSAKKNKLLVRLDEEMASTAINVVLDSVFEQNAVDLQAARKLYHYRYLEADEVLPKIAEDAVENALGTIQVFLRHNYTVNFWMMTNGSFAKYEVMDEVDLDSVRLELAHYRFATGNQVSRIPGEELSESACVFVTPNSYADANALLDSEGLNNHTTISAVLMEAAKQNKAEGSISLDRNRKPEKQKMTIAEKVGNAVKSNAIAYLLGFLLSTIVFSVFDEPFMSYWTILQALLCLGIVMYCEIIKEHKIIGTMLTTLLVFALISTAARQAFGDGLLNYMHWFMSGGESVETTTAYLMSILLIFTSFFAMVTYYFIRVLYRTSFLMLVSLIPFVIYVKVMLDIQIVQVVLVTVLNVVVFLVHYRTLRDAGKRKIGYVDGLVSVGMYAVIFVLVGLAVPETETKYYYMFENAFLGGNVSELLPEEYSEMSEYSGNADAFNDLNDRKLYVVKLVEPGTNLYLKRQTFDLYDFENDRWYPLEFYSEPVYEPLEWVEYTRGKGLQGLLEAYALAERYEPGILEKYGMVAAAQQKATGEDFTHIYSIETTNFPSVGYITPPGTMYVSTINDAHGDQDDTYVTRGGVFRRQEGFLHANLQYSVEFCGSEILQRKFMAAGGANQTLEEANQMLTQIREILIEHGETQMAEVVAAYLQENADAAIYNQACSANTDEIPEKVKKLALKITKDCTYDWEKAAALQEYFRENGFVYDLSYKAPDDSVEYFLFEGKTGTCSDYASAYVLMARAVGLTVRYVEGFVPDEEYNGDYVVRTSCGHAYPEVYIPNMGYMIFEATIPATSVNAERGGNGMLGYILRVVIQLVMVFVIISAIIVSVLFMHLMVAPFVKEKIFMGKVKKAQSARAVVLLYRRLQRKYTAKELKDSFVSTPYEYAQSFEDCYGKDISEWVLLVEKAAYMQNNISMEEKERAIFLYEEAKTWLKQWKKKQKTEKK